MTTGFEHVRTWVFDLDHTLYPPSARLFDQIEARMTAWVMEALRVGHVEADRLRASYWSEHGTTLAGLMARHEIDAAHFLREVHDIDFGVLTPDPALASAIRALPGRKLIYTNGTASYAGRVTEALGLSACFDALYGIEEAGLIPKPQRAAFEAVFAMAGVEAGSAAMFEDDARNLAVPHEMGARTVLVGPVEPPQPHVHHRTEDLAGFLSRLLADPARAP